jgi:hypothetical protein
MGAAIGAVFALFAIAVALVLAVVYPALNGLVIALATGLFIGVVALAVTVVIAALYRHRLPTNNDAWVFW